METPDINNKIIITSQTFLDKGLCGLHNLGNTCFMNSAIQCLTHTEPLISFFMSNSYLDDLKKKSNEKSLTESFNELIRYIWFKNATIMPAKFLNLSQKLAFEKNIFEFAGFAQNDSVEYLLYLLESLHLSLAYKASMEITGTPKNERDNHAVNAYKNWEKFFKNEYSQIIKIFYGQFITKIDIYNDDKSIKETNFLYEPFNCLLLDIPSINNRNINIYDCIDKYCIYEDVNNNRKKCSQFWKLPDILIISFKRFDINRNKIDTDILFPITELNLSKYMNGYNSHLYKYDLYAVIHHTGNTNGGHYYASIRNSNGKWYVFNDSQIFEEDTDRLIKNAYCLFYRLQYS
jgi:ubiquitin C-terminal hydrolase